MTVYSPADAVQACEIVKQAANTGQTLCIEGGGTRSQLGRPITADANLSTKELSGIVFYEPAEMVIRAKAGTPLSTIESALESHNQMLPFEPMDHRKLFGGSQATVSSGPAIGSLAACNLSGPRRIRAGAARDALIGVRFVNGKGEEISSGGRVMKNVTGLDLVKLQCGAFGTLGLLTEVTFRLLPKPEATGTLIFENLDDAVALKAMSMALSSPYEVSGAAHVTKNGIAQTAIRIEHFSSSVDYRLNALAGQLQEFGRHIRLDTEQSTEFWNSVRDAEPIANPRERAIWRLSLNASVTASVLHQLRDGGLAFDYIIDHGGGLLWLAVECGDDAQSEQIRGTIAPGKGHAMLVRAPDSVRQTVDVFHPPSDAVMNLSRGLKHSIDPAGVFNPGRMYAGI